MIKYSFDILKFGAILYIETKKTKGNENEKVKENEYQRNQP